MNKTIYTIFEIAVSRENEKYCSPRCRFYEDDSGAAGVAWCRLKDDPNPGTGSGLVRLSSNSTKCEHCGHRHNGYLRRQLCLAGENH